MRNVISRCTSVLFITIVILAASPLARGQQAGKKLSECPLPEFKMAAGGKPQNGNIGGDATVKVGQTKAYSVEGLEVECPGVCKPKGDEEPRTWRTCKPRIQYQWTWRPRADAAGDRGDVEMITPARDFSANNNPVMVKGKRKGGITLIVKIEICCVDDIPIAPLKHCEHCGIAGTKSKLHVIERNIDVVP